MLNKENDPLAGFEDFFNDISNCEHAVRCVKALDGLSGDALDGGWNFKEMSAHAKALEKELESHKRMFNRAIRELAEIAELCGGDENAIAIDCVKKLLAARQA
jgi:hypothetical protein